jgi:chromosome segregation protein
MYLQKLEIIGFKSFAEKTELKFNRQMTAIVGPNGSGKSNVADSLRWVLGEQSLKLLRGKKAEDVIFSGSEKKARLGFAEVSAYLNNEDGQAPIDMDEVVITRRIFRSGESEFYLNKNKVRLLDIHLLLAKASVGQRNYSIIGQGMIESVLSASPAERKEFFDEATGVREHQIKKDQAQNKLDRSAEALKSAEAIMAELEPRLKTLSRLVKRLEHREQIQTELSDAQNTYYSSGLNQLNKFITTQELDLNQLTEKKQLVTANITELQRQLDEQKNSKTASQKFNDIQQAYEQLVGQKATILRQLANVNANLEQALKGAGNHDAAWLTGKQAELADQHRQILTELETAKKQFSEIKHTVSAIQDAITEANKNVSLPAITSLKQAADAFKQIINQYEDLLNELDGQELTFETQAKIIKRGQELKKSLHELHQQMDAQPQTSDSGATELNDLKQRLNAEQVRLGVLEETTRLRSQQATNLEQQLNNINRDLQAASGKVSDDQHQQQLLSEKNRLETELEKIDVQANVVKDQLETLGQQESSSRAELFALQQQSRLLQNQLDSLNAQEQNIRIDLAKIQTKHEDLLNEAHTELGPDWQPTLDLQTENAELLNENIKRLKQQLAIIGAIDNDVINEHADVSSRFEFLSQQSQDLNQAISSCKSIIKELDEKIQQQFSKNFEKINLSFQRYFKTLFNGGNSKLVLNLQTENVNDNMTEAEAEAAKESNKNKPAVAGIDILATPPGKRLTGMTALSGGEKALTAIALICSIIATNPSPFVVLDEVDAALDEANSERFSDIVKELSDKTQFICITHNRATMHNAALLYGITMGGDSVSRLLSVSLEKAEEIAQ